MEAVRDAAKGWQKVKRIFGWALLAALVGAVAVVVWIGTSIDAIVARAIRSYGSAALGTDVDVGEVEIELRAGRGTIRALRIANPDGFSDEDALRFEELSISLVPESVVESPLQLTRVRLLDPQVRFEVDAGGRSNIQVLRDNAAAYAPRDEDVPETETGEPLRIRIDELSMERGALYADLRAVGNEARETTLPSFRLTNLGGRAGAEPAGLAKQLAQDLMRQIARATVRERIGSAIGSAVEDLLQSLEGDEE